jgi:hypothetical protein
MTDTYEGHNLVFLVRGKHTGTTGANVLTRKVRPDAPNVKQKSFELSIVKHD